jgi:two-component system, response regulator / RNA-binding antiterminator
MRILVVDESDERAALLGEALTAAGHEVIATLSSPLELLRAVDALRPDVIVIDTESPTRDVLEHVVIVSQSSPRPIVMFASDAGGAAIRDAVRAGVSAYIVDGLDSSRVNSIVEVACARFEEYQREFQRLKIELAEANLKLSERKQVERAKGLLMQSRGLSEDEAYHALRKLAMSKKLRLGDIAQQVIDTAELLGKG